MEKVTVLDKTFRLSISEEEIQKRVSEIAAQMNEDLKDKSPLFVCILNGAFMFASDVFKKITVPNASITFFRLSSYTPVLPFKIPLSRLRRTNRKKLRLLR